MEAGTQDFPKRILLAVTGLTPQVVTETVYALSMSENPFIPTEVHLICTEKGAERVRLTLLSEKPGWFQRLREEYGLPPIHFDQSSIHVIADEAGWPINDIRTPEDNRLAADFITERVRRFTADPEVALHVSIAGGRKTMGFFLGYALSLFGRPQDRLSHVLVSDPYESCWDFFFPTKASRVIFTNKNEPADASKAVVTLADIPFVPLRSGMGVDRLTEEGNYSKAVRAASRVFEDPSLEIDTAAASIKAGGVQIRFTPIQTAVYCWFAQSRLDEHEIVADADSNVAQLLAWYARFVGENSAGYEDAQQALRHGMDAEYLRPHRSRINQKLALALGKAAERYQIASTGQRGDLRYGLFGLEREQIYFVGRDE